VAFILQLSNLQNSGNGSKVTLPGGPEQEQSAAFIFQREVGCQNRNFNNILDAHILDAHMPSTT
jgi:hypothetical protein